MKLIQIKKKIDLIFLYETRIHPDVDKYLSSPAPQNFEQHLNYMDTNSQRFRILTDDHKYFGYSQITRIDQDSCELGFVIAPKYQGKGLGKTLVKLTIEEAKTQKYKCICLFVKFENIKAINLYQKLGFRIKTFNANSEHYMELEC